MTLRTLPTRALKTPAKLQTNVSDRCKPLVCGRVCVSEFSQTKEGLRQFGSATYAPDCHVPSKTLSARKTLFARSGCRAFMSVSPLQSGSDSMTLMPVKATRPNERTGLLQC